MNIQRRTSPAAATLLAATAFLLPTYLLAGCQADGEDNEGMRRGAASGALLGLTLGALTGDAELAARGAIVGGVAGGTAGSMADLENKRETQRTEIMADAIVGRGGGPCSDLAQSSLQQHGNAIAV